MLKGHVFSKQIFGHPIFALFINTFLNGENGISDNYKNGMAITYNNSTLTVQSGAVCIQGRFLEEDSSTDIPAGTDNSYCKLIIEIDLDKQNTDSEFVQGSYKIVKSSSSYPNLIQTNIVKNTSGIYQYELARFRTTSSGITDFTDMRTFLNFDSIYSAIQTEYRAILEQLKKELASVEDGSAYVLKNNIVVLRGKISVTGQSGFNTLTGSTTMNFPEGFTPENCFVISTSLSLQDNDNFVGGFETLSSYGYMNALLNGGLGKNVLFRKESNDILLSAMFRTESNLSETTTYNYDFKIVLMKYEISEDEFILGDITGDGIVDQEDLDALQEYLLKNTTFTEKQYKAADVNKDGNLDTGDTLKLSQYVNGFIDSLE